MRINKKKLKVLLDKYNIETLDEALGYIEGAVNGNRYLCNNSVWYKKYPLEDIEFNKTTIPFSGVKEYGIDFPHTPATVSNLIFSNFKLTAQLKRALKVVYNEKG